MSFVEQWQTQVNDSLMACARLVSAVSDIDLKYQLLVIGVLWPVRQPIQDFDFEAMQAVNEILGNRSKLVLQLVQQWEDDPLAVAQGLDAKTLQSGELGAALSDLIARFNAVSVFAKQLAGQSRVSQSVPSADEIPTQPSLGLPRVLVSYMRSDGEALATEVRQKLQEAGVVLWADLGQHEGTREWWQQITLALDRVDFLVLVMTPAAVKSKMVLKQWRYARQQGVCIYPVIKEVVDFSLLPRWISQVHFYNLNLEWSKLVSSLQGPCETPRIPFMVEDLPADFVNRPVELDQICLFVLPSPYGSRQKSKKQGQKKA